MIKKFSICALTALITLSSSTLAETVRYTQLGDTIYGSDGTRITELGDSIYITPAPREYPIRPLPINPQRRQMNNERISDPLLEMLEDYDN
jgi:hypothetical protein